ncbi:MAG: hypothetical protein H5T85_02355, partial [Actinobacteria bacterium]|nr:hypothetical protein [Actinomycetota bacterium]
SVFPFLSGCRKYDRKLDFNYFFKTEPEKATIDFLECLNNKDPGYIYDHLLPAKDRNNVSKEKFVEEFLDILSDVEKIEVGRTFYLGYEDNMSKVVVEFQVEYKNGEIKQYKKYMYLIKENDEWKVAFERTFI